MPSIIQRQMQINSEFQNLKRVREFISKAVTDSSLRQEDQNMVTLAVDESVANVVKHAYKTNPQGEIDIKVLADEEKFQVVIIDWGKNFHPEDIKNPDMEEHVRLGRPSGLGLYMIRKIMDEVIYTSSECNKLTLVKYIAPRQGSTN